MSEEPLDLSMKSRDRHSKTTPRLQNYEPNYPCPDSSETMEYTSENPMTEKRHVNADVSGRSSVFPHRPIARYPTERTMSYSHQVDSHSRTSGVQNYGPHYPCPDSTETMEYNSENLMNEEHHVNADFSGRSSVFPHAPIARYPTERTMPYPHQIDHHSRKTSGLQNDGPNYPCPDSSETMEYNSKNPMNEERRVNADFSGRSSVFPHAPIARYTTERTLTYPHQVDHTFQGPFVSTSHTEVNVEPNPSAQVHSAQARSAQSPSEQAPVLRPSLLQAPLIQAPLVQPPLVQPPLVQPPLVQPPLVQPPLVQAPLIQAPLIQAPLIQRARLGFINSLVRTLYRLPFAKPPEVCPAFVHPAFKRPLDVPPLRHIAPRPNLSVETVSIVLDTTHMPTGERTHEGIVRRPVTASPLDTVSCNKENMAGSGGNVSATAASLCVPCDKTPPASFPSPALTPRVVAPRKRRAEPRNRSSSSDRSSTSNTRVRNSRDSDDTAESDASAGVPTESPTSQDDSTSSLDDRDGATSSGVIKNAAYWERRRKNNEAAKKSRDARLKKVDDVEQRVRVLELENFSLKAEIEIRTNQVDGLREKLLYKRPGLDLFNVYTSTDAHN